MSVSGKTPWQVRRNFLSRLGANVQKDYIGLIAGGIAFYFLMAVFPALTAAISLYGIFADPHFISNQLNTISPFLPHDALKILTDQALTIVSADKGTLGVSFIISVLFALYSATQGMSALIQGLNIALNQNETRNMVVLKAIAFVLTFIMMIYGLTALILVAGIPALINIVGFPGRIGEILLWARWPALFFSAMIGLQILYCYGPSSRQRYWQWISWGSFLTTIFWLMISSLFSLFVSHFEQLNKTYGSLSAIVMLLLWFWLSGISILFGAEINATLAEGRQEPTAPGPAPQP